MHLNDPILIITIDLEEDNWGLYRDEITVENVRRILRLQAIFERYGVKPTYLTTYQVSLSEWATEILGDIAAAGKCEIGGHLHPWNTPPMNEDLSAKLSFLNNLPYELQLEKISTLTESLERSTGIEAVSFRGGRWGLADNTVKALLASGYKVDSSVTPFTSWDDEGGGPSYGKVSIDPYWYFGGGTRIDEKMKADILEVPVTIGYNHLPFGFWHRVYRDLGNKKLKSLHLIGLLYRSCALRKIWLSPEISSLKDMIRLSDILIRKGAAVLNFTFHSPSLLPGKSPFVLNRKDLEGFYAKIEKYFEYLHRKTRFQSLTLFEVRKALGKKLV